MATGPDPASRIAASAAWWAAFWARSYISIPQPPPVPQALMATCSGDASQTVLQAPNGSLTLPGGLCFVASASNAIEARPCSQAPPGSSWSLVQCTTPGCAAQGDFYVAFSDAADSPPLPSVRSERSPRCTRLPLPMPRACPPLHADCLRYPWGSVCQPTGHLCRSDAPGRV